MGIFFQLLLANSFAGYTGTETIVCLMTLKSLEITVHSSPIIDG